MDTRRVLSPLLDLHEAPRRAARRVTQALAGEVLRVSDMAEGWARVELEADGYIGFAETEWLGPALAPTHWLAVPMSHSYPAPDIKQGPESPLFLNSHLTVTGEDKDFLRLADGRFVKKSHTLPLGSHLSDPAAVALQYLCVPYLWGGKSFAGLDCSGLVQLALHACGHQAPRDSGPQQALGVPVSGDLRRNDLVFWKGHVGILTAPDRLLHANGHHMQVREEPLAEAITRIGPAEAIRRLQ